MAESRNSGSSEATERDKIIKAIYAAKISPQVMTYMICDHRYVL